MKMDSLQRILFSSKSMAVVLVILGIGLCFLLLRGQTQRKLNKRLTGASNADGDETRWLKTPWGLFVKPVIGYYRNEMLVDLPTISAYFLADDRYNFILPAPRWLRAFKFRFWLTKTLQPIPRPRRTKKWAKDPILRVGRTVDGKEVKVNPESLILILGIPDSGKSKVAYEMLEQLASKKEKHHLVVVDITKTFPKRLCNAAKARRIISTTSLLTLAEELSMENQRRQDLLDRFDVDHIRHLPSEHKIKPIWVFIEEAHVLFDRNQDLKSEKGKQVKEAADFLNELVLTGRKTEITLVFLSQSALKSESLINIGRSRTVITGYLSPSESDAIGLQGLAVNTGLKKGVFLVRSGGTGPEPVIMRAWHRDDRNLNKPLDLLENRPTAAAEGKAAGKGERVPSR